jgi:sRNA-binding carbon storage regulator CsrA
MCNVKETKSIDVFSTAKEKFEMAVNAPKKTSILHMMFCELWQFQKTMDQST